ncbi:cytochrome P450 [Amycolatopsis anabasis]|uniref:cytochrome P450 n=1 Tax=Amycolatopsis anabasis TaxID=1840409 RepID=UPI00131DFD17|nr:cytochrome P450 [Amycolatopsis anabasis]
MPGTPPGSPLDELTEDPHPVLARLRASEPVSWRPELNAWLVTRHDLALRVLRDTAAFTVDDPRFATAVVVGPSMLSTDGAEHARHRGPFTRDFRPAEVRARFGEFAAERARRLVADLRKSPVAEIRRGLAGPLAVAVIAHALGLAETGADRVLAWYDAIVSAVTGIAAGETPGPAGAAAFGELRASVEHTVRGDASLLAEAARGLELPEVVSNAAVLMFGGIETTEGMIANAAGHLLGHPAQLALVRADPGLLPRAIEESLRLEPAAAVVDRYATADAELGGARIRRGEQVTVSLAGANRDPAVFADPDAFDLRRADLRRHLAFAHGPHFCVAADLARLETRVALRALLDASPDVRLDGPFRPRGLVFRKPEALFVRWA